MACTVAVSFFQNPALDRESNTHPTFWPSKTVKRVCIRFKNIRYISSRLVTFFKVTDAPTQVPNIFYLILSFKVPQF
jgi:hypothetical protein